MRTALAMLFLGLAAPLSATPLVRVTDFDAAGDGIDSPTLCVTRVARPPDEALRLSQMVSLDGQSDYCLSFAVAVRNVAQAQPGNFRIRVSLGSWSTLDQTPRVLLRTTHRQRVVARIVSPPAGLHELTVTIDNAFGPFDDPVFYLDDISLAPLAERRVVSSSFDGGVYVTPTTIVGWEHDLRAARGPDEVIDRVELDVVVWDDPGEETGTSEIVEITANDVVVWQDDIGGSMEHPQTLQISIPWLECRLDVADELVVRLRTIREGPEPIGDLYFGSATARVHTGRLGASQVVNGAFDNGFESWTCNEVTCRSVNAERQPWSHVKSLYRE